MQQKVFARIVLAYALASSLSGCVIFAEAFGIAVDEDDIKQDQSKLVFDNLHRDSGSGGAGGQGGSSSSSSDRRDKRDIRYVGALPQGLRLYSFRYRDGSEHYVGVLAQDLIEDPRFRRAVSLGQDGYYRVNYAQLGIRLIKLSDWQRHGRSAVILRTVSKPDRS